MQVVHEFNFMFSRSVNQNGTQARIDLPGFQNLYGFISSSYLLPLRATYLKQAPRPARATITHTYIMNNEVLPIMRGIFVITGSTQWIFTFPLHQASHPLSLVIQERILAWSCMLLWIFFCPRGAPLDILVPFSRRLLARFILFFGRLVAVSPFAGTSFHPGL